MIPKEILEFLNDLSENNNREWFQENKSYYEKTKKLFEVVAQRVIAIANEVDQEIGFLEPKDCTFRIYRDVRFSKDKSPYKNNMGAYANKGGKKSPYGGYYLHIEPENSFIAGGIHSPDSTVLGKIRQEIYNFPEDFKQVIENKTFKNTFGAIQGDKLKGAPRGFDKEFQYIDYLKYKSYAVWIPLSDEQVLSSDFEKQLKKYFEILSPFVKFLNHAVAEN